MLLQRRACRAIEEPVRSCCSHTRRRRPLPQSAARRSISTDESALGRAVDYRVSASPVSAYERSWTTTPLTAAAIGELLRNVRDLQARSDQPPLHDLSLDDFPVRILALPAWPQQRRQRHDVLTGVCAAAGAPDVLRQRLLRRP